MPNTPGEPIEFVLVFHTLVLIIVAIAVLAWPRGRGGDGRSAGGLPFFGDDDGGDGGD